MRRRAVSDAVLAHNGDGCGGRVATDAGWRGSAGGIGTDLGLGLGFGAKGE